MNTRTITLLKWIGIASVAIAILYAVLLILANRSLAKAYAALEADGRPMKAEQVIPISIPESDNAALLYDSAILRLKSEKAGEENLFSILSKTSREILVDNPKTETINEFRSLIQKTHTEDALALIQQGTLKAGCYYDLDYSKGPALALPHVSDLLSISRILNAKARMQALDGNHDGAWQTLITSLRFADALRKEPILISQLVRITQFSLTTSTIQTQSLSSSPSPTQLKELMDLITIAEDNTPLIVAVDSERILFGDWVFNKSRSELKEVAEMVDSNDSGYTLVSACPPLFHRDHAAYLQVMHSFVKNSSPIYTKKDTGLDDTMLNNVPKYCILTRMLVPAISSVKRSYYTNIATARITRIGLALLSYRQEHGSFPKELATLNIQNLADPFLGEELHYSVTSTGFTIHSIGQNLISDGGVKSKNKQTGDIVWEYKENAESNGE